MAKIEEVKEKVKDMVERDTIMLLTKYMAPLTVLKSFAKFNTKSDLNDDEFLQNEKIEIILPNETLTTPNAIVNAPTSKRSKVNMTLHAIGAGVPINQQILKNSTELALNNMMMAACVHTLALDRTVYILNALLAVPHMVQDAKLKKQHYFNMSRLIASAMTPNGWSASNMSYIGEQFSGTRTPQNIFGMIVDLQSHYALKGDFPINNSDQLLAQMDADWIEPKEEVIAGIKIATIPKFYSSVRPALNLDCVWSLYMASFLSSPASIRGLAAGTTSKYRLCWPNWEGGAWSHNLDLGGTESALVVMPVDVEGTFGIVAYGPDAPVSFVEGSQMYSDRVKDANTHMETVQFKRAIGAQVLDPENVLVLPCRSVRSITTRLVPDPTNPDNRVPTVQVISLDGTPAKDETQIRTLQKDNIFIIKMTAAAVKIYRSSTYPTKHVFDLSTLLSLGSAPGAPYDPSIRANFFDNQEINIHRVPDLGLALAMPMLVQNLDAMTINMPVAPAAALVNTPRPQEIIDAEGPGKTLSGGVLDAYTLQAVLPPFSYENFVHKCDAALPLD